MRSALSSCPFWFYDYAFLFSNAFMEWVQYICLLSFLRSVIYPYFRNAGNGISNFKFMTIHSNILKPAGSQWLQSSVVPAIALWMYRCKVKQKCRASISIVEGNSTEFNLNKLYNLKDQKKCVHNMDKIYLIISGVYTKCVSINCSSYTPFTSNRKCQQALFWSQSTYQMQVSS